MEVPRLNGREFLIFSFLLPGDWWAWGQGAGFVPYPEGLVRPGGGGRRGPRGGDLGGGERKER